MTLCCAHADAQPCQWRIRAMQCASMGACKACTSSRGWYIVAANVSHACSSGVCPSLSISAGVHLHSSHRPRWPRCARNSSLAGRQPGVHRSGAPSVCVRRRGGVLGVELRLCCLPLPAQVCEDQQRDPEIPPAERDGVRSLGPRRQSRASALDLPVPGQFGCALGRLHPQCPDS